MWGAGAEASLLALALTLTALPFWLLRARTGGVGAEVAVAAA